MILSSVISISFSLHEISSNVLYHLQGTGFRRCCNAEDYSITVGGQATTIGYFDDGTIEVVPPHGPWAQDNLQGQASTVFVSLPLLPLN